jgi:hypothetical protein
VKSHFKFYFFDVTGFMVEMKFETEEEGYNCAKNYGLEIFKVEKSA